MKYWKELLLLSKHYLQINKEGLSILFNKSFSNCNLIVQPKGGAEGCQIAVTEWHGLLKTPFRCSSSQFLNRPSSPNRYPERNVKMKIFIGCLFLIFLMPSITLACDCDWNGPFVTVVNDPDILVLHARIKEYRNFNKDAYETHKSMIVEVLDVFKSQIEEKEIEIWGDNGILCRPYVNQFPIGTEWLLGIQRDADGIFSISICGEYWLEVQNGVAKGRIKDPDSNADPIKMNLLDMKNMISKMDNHRMNQTQ